MASKGCILVVDESLAAFAGFREVTAIAADRACQASLRRPSDDFRSRTCGAKAWTQKYASLGAGLADPSPHLPLGFFTLQEDQACYAADLTTT